MSFLRNFASKIPKLKKRNSESTTGKVKRPNFAVVTMAAIGIIFGDIGTSPLYAFKICFDSKYGIPLAEESIYAVLSMIIWSYLLIVTIKYVLFVLRINNHGEGGVLALMAMALRTAPLNSKKAEVILTLGVLGACLFYGDAVITPAISVLSAVEGLEVTWPNSNHYVVMITIAILMALFMMQRIGTSVIGFLFGSRMIMWFFALAAMGIYQIIENPSILLAFSPHFAISFVKNHATQAFIVIGVVFLAITGVEAIYADIGHFGLRPVQVAWIAIIMPSLILNYLGQGAMLLSHPGLVSNPFFSMVPENYTFGLVILATIATVIASQAVISGTYSMTSQASLLGLLPKLRIITTSKSNMGQIYIPTINWILCIGVILVVLVFRNSQNLAPAYGLCVSLTMLVTVSLAAIVIKSLWKLNIYLASALLVLLFSIDLIFLISNITKFLQGGWFPIFIAALCFIVFMTWYAGQKILRNRNLNEGVPTEEFIKEKITDSTRRVSGLAVFLSDNPKFIPHTLLSNFKQNGIFHDHIVLLKISIWDIPVVGDADRLSIHELGKGVYSVRVVYGFTEKVDINAVLKDFNDRYNLTDDLLKISIFAPRISVSLRAGGELPLWRQRLFAWLIQNETQAVDYYDINLTSVVQLGYKVQF